MNESPSVFLSYSRDDQARAAALERALKDRGLAVWRDIRSIAAGERWSDAIERAIRGARGVVVLITAASASSEWVTYEYAFATGAGIPVIAVSLARMKVPEPIQRFQVVRYSNARSVAKQIDEGIRGQARAIGQERAATPMLVSKFRESNGEICLASGGRTPAIWLELWVENAPWQTERVSFEILDVGFRDRTWSVRRGRDSLREFLTDDLNSYGDVEIWARGSGPGPGKWAIHSGLYEALRWHYRSRPSTHELRRALKQIRDN